MVAVLGDIENDDDDFGEAHDINVTPFIDVMLVLLIIFMVAAPLSTVDLPSSTAVPQPKPEKPICHHQVPSCGCGRRNCGEARRSRQFARCYVGSHVGNRVGRGQGPPDLSARGPDGDVRRTDGCPGTPAPGRVQQDRKKAFPAIRRSQALRT